MRYLRLKYWSSIKRKWVKLRKKKSKVMSLRSNKTWEGTQSKWFKWCKWRKLKRKRRKMLSVNSNRNRKRIAFGKKKK